MDIQLIRLSLKHINMKNENNWKQRYYAQKKELKRLNKALETTHKALELSCYRTQKEFDSRQELYKQFCLLEEKMNSHRCFWGLFKKD